MNHIRSFGLLTVAALVVACGGGGQPTSAPATANPATASPPTSVPATAAPATEAPATDAPATDAPATGGPSLAPPTVEPGASLDPSQSDAGIVARVTISNDSFMGRDGTHDIYGVADDGSECDGSFEEPDYTVVAWYDDAPNGMIHRFGITVGADDVPAEDGSTTVEDGRVSFDFVSESGFGTQYTAAPGEGSAVIDITRDGSTLTFDFEGSTSAGVNLVGQFVCADA